MHKLIHLLEAVNTKEKLGNGVIIAYSIPQEPVLKGVEPTRTIKYLRINNNSLFSLWAKNNVRRSEDDVEAELIGYINRNELTMIGLEEDYEYEKSLGYKAAYNSLYKALSNFFSDKRVLMIGAFAATVTFTTYLLPKVSLTLPITIVMNPTLERGG